MTTMQLPDTIRQARQPIDIVLPCRSKLRKWAFENAYTLILMAFMFGVTWIVMLTYGVLQYAK